MFLYRFRLAISIAFTIGLLEGGTGWCDRLVAWLEHWLVVIVSGEELA